jgi:hypothetical protein
MCNIPSYYGCIYRLQHVINPWTTSTRTNVRTEQPSAPWRPPHFTKWPQPPLLSLLTNPNQIDWNFMKKVLITATTNSLSSSRLWAQLWGLVMSKLYVPQGWCSMMTRLVWKTENLCGNQARRSAAQRVAPPGFSSTPTPSMSTSTSDSNRPFSFTSHVPKDDVLCLPRLEEKIVEQLSAS